MASKNPYSAGCHGGVTYYVACFANAAYKQRVTITPPSGVTGGNAIFVGNGEGNINMTLTQRGFLTAPPPNGQASFTPPGTFQQLSVYSVLFEHSADGGSTWTKNLVNGLSSEQQTVGNGATGVVFISSEDATDNDYNDSTCLLTYYKLDTST